MIVPLPPPEGELTTKSVPRGVAWLTGPASCSSFTLLDILNLLAKFLHFGFDRQARLLDYKVCRLRKSGIGFSIKLLKQEVEHLSCLARSIKCLLKLREMAAQSDHLLTHVAAIGKVGNFLGQSCRVDLNHLPAAIQQFSNSFLQAQAICIGETGRGGLYHRNERLNLLHAFTQLVLESLTFLHAHLFEIVQGLVQCLFERCRHSFIDAVARRLQRTGNSRDYVDVELPGDIEVLLKLLQRIHVTGDEWTVQFVSDLRRSLHTDCDVHTAARQSRGN